MLLFTCYVFFVGMNRSTYHNYEQGAPYPKVPLLIQIALTLDLTIDYLMGLTDTRDSLSAHYDTQRITPFGERLRALRRKYGMIQQSVIDAPDVANSSYYVYEYNQKYPSKQHLLRLAGLFDVPLTELPGFDKKA